MAEERDAINIWIAYTDLFAGILIVFAVFYGLQFEKEFSLKKELEKKVEYESTLKKELQEAHDKAANILDRVAKEINKRYKGTNKKVTSDGIQLTIPSDVTFGSGSYRIKIDSEAWLLNIGQGLRVALNDLSKEQRNLIIEVRGHTDAYPVIATNRVTPTNWELSSRRATEIIKFFQVNNVFDPTQVHIVATGVAEFEEWEKNFDSSGTLREPEELEDLRKIQIRIVPNYEEIFKSIFATEYSDKH